MSNLALTTVDYNDLMQCKKKGFHHHTTVLSGPNLGRQWIYVHCNDGCHPVTLLEATSHEQIELAKIVAEDKEASPRSVSALSTLVKKRKVQCEKASKRLAAAINNMLNVERDVSAELGSDASRSVVVRSEEHIRKADQHLEIVKALHDKAAATLRTAREAWQCLEELQDCTSDKALHQYLVHAGLATGLQGDQRRLYVSAKTKETGVTGALEEHAVSPVAETSQVTPQRPKLVLLATLPTTVTRKGNKRKVADIVRSEMVDGVEIVYARINGVQTIGEQRDSSPEGQATPSKRAWVR
ncbi:hypothetical protein EDD85DRAFT_789737 [Armillaria nabsnona]|nr:hypothetical protein EDD85DRAFT_789737 [Armillaria nabsnona]